MTNTRAKMPNTHTQSKNSTTGEIAAQSAAGRQNNLSSETDSPVPHSPLRIMVIDDSKTIRRSAESLLNKEGWQVYTAVDGFDALAKVVEHKPDIVFVDIMMPRLDGYQTCALIKNNAQFSKTPVIMLSSKDSIFDKAKGRVVGSEHYLTKPFTRDDLYGAIHRHVPALSQVTRTVATSVG